MTSTIDYLNLTAGIAHQDIAGRNILLDTTTTPATLKLFDFDVAAGIGDTPKLQSCRNDVDGMVFTIYETFTKDFSYRRIPHEEQKIAAVEEMPNWPLEIALAASFPKRDPTSVPEDESRDEVQYYRDTLARWAQERRSTRLIKHPSEATDAIWWPPMPPMTPVTWRDEYHEGELQHFRLIDIFRKQAKKMGLDWIDWERAPACGLEEFPDMTMPEFDGVFDNAVENGRVVDVSARVVDRKVVFSSPVREVAPEKENISEGSGDRCTSAQDRGIENVQSEGADRGNVPQID